MLRKSSNQSERQSGCMNDYLVEKLCKLKVTECPYFEYWYGGGEYFGACLITQGACDNQPNCQYKKEQLTND